MSFNTELRVDVNQVVERFSGRGIDFWPFRRKYMSLTFYSEACGKECQRFTSKVYKEKVYPVFIRTTFKYIIVEEPEQLDTGEVFYLEFRYPYHKKDILLSSGMLCPSERKKQKFIRKRP